MNKHKTKHKNKYTHLMFFCVAFLSICFNFTTMINIHAINSSISVSVADIIELNVLPTIGGSFASSTASNNVSVKTDNGTGYELGIKAGTEGSNSLTRAGGGSIPSLSIAGGINEDTYRTNSDYNNTWGFKPSKYNSSANSNYLPAPSSASTTTVLDKTTTSNPSAYNDYTINIGSRVASGTPSGSYSNTFVFTVTANPAIYSITYNANGASVSNMPANISNQTTSSETVNISSTVPTRSNYTFEGWCTVQVADGTACSGTSYAAGSTWTIDKTAASSSLTLYARWKSLFNKECDDWSTCMQNVDNPPACGTTMTDGRDGNTYTTATIGGVCWMTQNLRFNGTSLVTKESNVSSSITMSYGNLVSGDSYTEARIATSPNANYGVYYNFCAASAGEACNNTVSQSSTRSVCPAGWTLPTNAQMSAIPQKDSHFTNTAGLAGAYSAGTLYLAGSRGLWWNSTSGSKDYQGMLGWVVNNEYWVVGSTYKYAGGSIRCVRNS